MPAPEPRRDVTLHRTWPFECVVVRAATPAELAAALDAAGETIATDAASPLAVTARAIGDRFASGQLAAAIVADSSATLAVRVRQAREQIVSGAGRIDADGLHYERMPRVTAAGRSAGAVWLFEGADAVRPWMLRDLSVWLPGFVEAFDRVAAQEADPGRMADFLFGSGGAEPDAATLDATARARLALAAGGVLARWLLRVLPPPARALGGPGAGAPWLDTRALAPGQIEACPIDAVAASPDTDWNDRLASVAIDPDDLVLHVGPGRSPAGRSGVVALQPEGVDGLRAFLDGLARLAAAGLPVDLHPLFDLRGVSASGAAAKSAPAARTFVFQPRSPRFDPRVVTLPAGAARPETAIEPAPPAAGDDRAGIVLEHLETMRLFLDQYQETVRRFYGGTPAAPGIAGAAAPADPGPMLHRILSLVPGERLTASARYDVSEAVFLRQHTPNVSAVSSVDPGAFGLPVMPLTFSMEALAEAAALLAPDRVVTGFERLDAQRWMTFERGAVDAGITAEVAARGDRMEVEAALFDPADPRRVYLAGRVVLERGYPAAPPAPVPALRGAVTCDWGVDEIYPRRGFHGPMLRAITRIGEHGETGMTGELTVLPRSPLFASAPRPAFRIDPVLLDALGMGVGIWTWREEMNGVYPVPFRVGRIRLYGPPPPEGERLAMQVSITRNRDGMIAADLFATRPDGRLHAAAEGWEDYVYRLPLAVHRTARDPFGQRIAAPVDPAPGGASLRDVALVEFPALAPGFFTAAEGIWEKILAWYWLDPGEREEWTRRGGEPAGRIAWLAGRAALKDAARSVLASRGRKVGAYDVPIGTSDDGRPLAEGLSLALAVHGDRVWAAAADAGRGAIGLVVEAPGAAGDAIGSSVFGPGDRDRLRPLDGDWIARAWCAKRAAAAALGHGAALDLRGLEIETVDPASGEFRLRPAGALVTAAGGTNVFANAIGIEAVTLRRDDLIVALCRVAGAPIRGSGRA
ncbi:MAG TPA: polyketide synthase dehydratase domain-containing protein [Patescibacteria group bacterium]|nr:polyketide synthase dehydratase domain-containing protein [Patescibacteria group bacterium]